MHYLHSEEYRAFLVKLVAARELRGLTQIEVAAALKIPQSQLSRMETGQRRVDAIEFVMFARLYRKPLSFFVKV